MYLLSSAVVSVDAARRTILVKWSAEHTAQYPWIWLRDNCPTNFHPQTDERVYDLFQIPVDISVASIEIADGQLRVCWEDGHQSQFLEPWLIAHQPGQIAPDPARIAPVYWRASLNLEAIPRLSAALFTGDEGAMLDWMTATKKSGFGLITGLVDADSGMAAAARIGFLRRTNFGTVFDVVSKPDPNNLAYTPIALPLHTDLTNQEIPPGFQFLHCIANEAAGGESLFCDGFAIADDLRQQNPRAFDLLSNVYIPTRFHDQDVDIRQHERVIRLDHLGQVAEIRFNAHLAGVFDLPVEDMADYYEAYRAYMVATRSKDYGIRFKLQAGEMVVFDNRRILHGRQAFDLATGFRHLRGCYVDRGEWDSRMRVLTRQLKAC